MMSLVRKFTAFYLSSALLALSVSPVGAQQLSPDWTRCVNQGNGHILQVLGRREEASADFRRGLSIDPSIEKGSDALKALGIFHPREDDGWFLA